MPSDPTLYLYTSLTAGSSHIITATSRIETILKANKIPFKAVDIATDEKARLIWQRRSKGKKIPGLVKFNDVIADFEQIEEWNEYGELEDEIEAVIDIFGDVPVSSTSAEAQAAAAERAKAQQQQSQVGSQTGSGSSQARTASETRHISISEPTGERKKSEGTSAVSESPMNMAMRQAGAEAAAKAGLKKNSAPAAAPAASASTIAAAGVAAKKPVDVTPETTSVASTASTLPESQEPSTVTDAKTPTQLAQEGAPKISLDKVNNPATAAEDASTGQSTLAQTLDQRRKSSVPATPSALSKSTSISESHTIPESPTPTDTLSPASSRVERPRTEHRGSNLDPANAEVIKAAEKRNSIAEVDEEEDEDESSEDESDEEEEVVGKGGKTVVGATDKQERKVTGSGKAKTQEQGAKDVEKVGVSVGD